MILDKIKELWLLVVIVSAFLFYIYGPPLLIVYGITKVTE